MENKHKKAVNGVLKDQNNIGSSIVGKRTETRSVSVLVWIIIVALNNYADTAECLVSLCRLAYPSYYIIVVDNGSDDGTAEHIRVDFPQVKVLETGTNLGFAAGYNVGFRYALQRGAEYIFMLNNDTIVDPNVLPYLMLAARQTNVSVYVPIVYYYAAPDKVWSAGARYRLLPPAFVMEKHVYSARGSYKDLDFAIGCALLIHRNAFEQIGLWDENYFFNWEDLDFSVRLRRQNLRIVQVPGAKVWHKVSRTTRPATALFWEMHGESSAIFFRRHYARPYLAMAVHLSYFAVREFFLKRRFAFIKSFLRGLNRGLHRKLRAVPRIESV